MAEQRKISQLPVLSQISGDEYFHIAYNGRSHKVTMNALISHFSNGVDLNLLEQIREQVANIPDFSGFINQEQLNNALAALEIPGQVSLDGLATTEQVTEAIAAAISGIQHPSVDLSNYPTKQEVDQSISNAVAAVEHPAVDLEPYVTKTDLNQALADLGHGSSENIDLTVYATKTELENAISGIQIPPAVDISGLATKTEVQEALQAIEIPSTEGLITEEQAVAKITEAIAAIPSPEVQDLSGLATKEEVQQQFEALSIPSIEGLATTEQLQQAISDIQIPAAVDISGLATKQELTEAIANIQHPAVDLSPFATTEQLDSAIGNIQVPSIEGLASEETVDSKIAEAISNIDIPAPVDISGLATQSSVALAVEELATEMGQQIMGVHDVATAGIGRIMWVDGFVRENATGSITSAFASIQQAIDAIPANGSNWIILVAPVKAGGTGYTSFTFTAKQNILIQGFGCVGSHMAQIVGSVTVTGAATTRFRMKDIAIRPPVNTVGLILDGTAGRHYFDNVNIEEVAGSTAPVVKFTNGEQRWTAFTGCDIIGRVEVEASAAAGLTLYFNNNNGATHLEVNSAAIVNINNGMFGSIEATDGSGYVRNAVFSGKDGKAITNVGTGTYRARFTDFAPQGVALVNEGVQTSMCVEA